MKPDPRTRIEFGRYDNKGRLVEAVVSHVDIDTGHLLEPVDLARGLMPAVWVVLYPGGILCTTPLIVQPGARPFDAVVPA